MKSALLVIDMQNDFVRKGGALMVPGAEGIIPAIRRIVTVASGKGIPIFFTMDWHEKNDREFSSEGWPRHCVRGTRGAEIVRELAFCGGKREIVKNTQYDKFPNTGLETTLDGKGVKRLFLTGVATEYCIRFTALGAIKRGFEVLVIRDAVRPVEEHHGAKVLEGLKERGVGIISSEKALNEFNQSI